MQQTYYKYPTSSDSISPSDANYDETGLDDLTDVDFGSASPYNTFGQGGNVWEWNETVAETFYALRGGAFLGGTRNLESTTRINDSPNLEYLEMGFRIVSMEPVVVPEPSTYAAIFGALALGFATYRRRSIAPKK